MIHLFGEKEVRDLEILAIQEPYINKHTDQVINKHTDQVTTYSQMLGNRFHLLIKPTSKDTNVANVTIPFNIRSIGGLSSEILA